MDGTRSKLAASQQQQQQIRQQEMRRKALAADAEGGLDLPAVEGHASGVSPADTSTFQLIQFCAYHIRRSVDDALSYDALRSGPADYAVVRPLTSLFAQTRHPGILHALLLCRHHFLDAADDELAFQGLNHSRAALCELLAVKLLSLYDSRSYELSTVLTSYYNPFAGAILSSFDAESRPSSQADLDELVDEGEEDSTSAISLAIATRSLHFIRAPPVQRFIDDLHAGHFIYRPSGQRAIIADSYKSKNIIEPYDIQSRSLMDHYVLRVPRIRKIVEFGTIVALLGLFSLLQRKRDLARVETPEVLFMIFAMGFALEEITSIKERGLKTYSQQIWNVLDMAFLVTFFSYFVLRMVALHRHSARLSELAFDILALGACVLFPRLCGVLLKDSLVMLGLGAMLRDFFAFLVLAVVCSFGFLLSFVLISEGKLTVKDAAWLLTKVFLGSSYLGFDVAPGINETLGPGLMLVYAVFSNVLLLTILISILSTTFAVIQLAVVDEALFQRAAATLDMVKGDALAEFLVPNNLVALPLLLLASFVLGERRFHQFNVFLIRVTSFPLLATIWLFYALKRLLVGPGRIRLPRSNGRRQDETSSSGVWQSLTSQFDGKTANERVFERKVSKEGRSVRGMGPDARGSKDSLDAAVKAGPSQIAAATSPAPESEPLALRGSGGRKALGMRSSSPAQSVSGTSAQPVSMLAQLFGGSESLVGARLSGAAEKERAQSEQEAKNAAMQQQLDRIEEMVAQLLTGGIKLEDKDQDMDEHISS